MTAIFKRTKERRFPADAQEYEHRIVDIARVTRVVKGGRRFRFRAVVVLGNRKGKIGIGVAKDHAVSGAIEKAIHQAKRSMISLPLKDRTIPYEVEQKYGSARVMLRPGRKGRGLIAGGAVRTVCDLAGIHDITSKVLSSSGNKLNVAKATLKALRSIRLARDASPLKTAEAGSAE